MENLPSLFILSIIALALLFDFLNGVNDAANSIATVVTTRVLSPRLAVAWAAFFNFAAFLFFGVKVASTIGKGIVNPEIVTEYVVLAALVGAVSWTHLCNTLGLPISVSHSIIGGFVGAALVKSGVKALLLPGLLKVTVFIFLAPMIGMVLGFVNMVILYWVFRRALPKTVDGIFRKLQLVSAAMFSLGHGTNDAQKTMGIIAVLLFSTGHLGKEFNVPFWLVITCHTAIGLGTLFGGWRVIRTMGTKITKLEPSGGFSAETAGAASLFAATTLGIPVSTTHTITGAIMGVGVTRGLSTVRWTVARRILWTWILTIPASAVVSALMYLVLEIWI